MDSETYERLSNKYDILRHIGFNEYQIKIWIMSHMDIQDKIDVQGFGKFSCISFMRKGKSYQDLIAQVNELVKREVLFIPDKHAHIIEYRFNGQSQYAFRKLILGATEQFRNRGSSELANLFRDCLRAENESSFINSNLMEFFDETKKDPIKIKEFLANFLVANASSYSSFILQLLG